MKYRHKKVLMWLPFFIGMLIGNPFKNNSFWDDEDENDIKGLDTFICVMYHTTSVFFLIFLVVFFVI